MLIARRLQLGLLAILWSAAAPGAVLGAWAQTPPHLLSWGTMGDGEGQFIKPLSVAVGSDGSVFVADVFGPQHLIQKFTPEGVYLQSLASQGAGQGQIRDYVSGLAINASNQLYAVDYVGSKIVQYTSTGSFIREWGSFGTGPGQFKSPKAIAVGPDGSVYVADTNNARVQKFSSTGAFLTEWGSSGTADGQFQLPYGIAVANSGAVYVSDFSSSHTCIQRFSSEGAFEIKWGVFGSSGDGAFQNPYGLDVDKYGHLYVADVGNHQIQVFDASGGFLLRWGSLGTGPGQFNLPADIAVDDAMNIYVVDNDNSRVEKFGATATGTGSSSWGRIKAYYRR